MNSELDFHEHSKGKDQQTIEKMMNKMHEAMMMHKKVRLIEDKMSYEDLAVQ